MSLPSSFTVVVVVVVVIGGIQNSSKFDGVNENCNTWTFFSPLALRSASFNGYGFLSTRTNRTFVKNGANARHRLPVNKIFPFFIFANSKRKIINNNN